MDMSLSKPLEIEKGREAWGAAVHGVKKSQAQLSDWITIYLQILFSLKIVLFIQQKAKKHFSAFFCVLIKFLYISHYRFVVF